MDFSISDDHRAIREGVGAVVRRFDDEYWLARDEDGEFPKDFHRAMVDAGWLGITMPQEYGGAGLNYVSASPYRIPAARLAAAQAALSVKVGD